MTIPRLENRAARRLFLHLHGLGEPTTGSAKGPDLCALIERLGFVQIDSINTVERAHHMILHARHQSYRPDNLAPLLEQDRTLFEHWTHDAAIIPTSFYPHWHLRFERDAKKLRDRWKKSRRAGINKLITPILSQIHDTGPVCSTDVGENETRGSGGWWDWLPSKTALEYLWRSGQLSVTRRVGFRKFYDLTSRVIPHTVSGWHPETGDTIDWACNGAIDRLGFATSGEIAAFWAKATPKETRHWCTAAVKSGTLIEIEIENADGSTRTSFARPDVIKAAQSTQSPPKSARILSPFDPALRDRDRTERLFGFHYRIEVFVPKAKRKFGYYVFPVLEGERLIGRIDMKSDRSSDTLNITAFWPEPGISMGKTRTARLHGAIKQTARFSGAKNIDFDKGWLRT
ncbi:MAG: hypothetical protein COB40_01785 [Marinosulfonomonas sp.]|nr:MAG: hypothetical protein COB40_01785 [Marinosulfonomonas sp.]